MRHHGGAERLHIFDLLSMTARIRMYWWYYSAQNWSIFYANLSADFSPIFTPRAIFTEYNADIRPPQYY
jgi:hypothetical protein